MKQIRKWLVTAVLALLMMIPAVLAEETASFMTLTVPTTAQEIDLGQNVVTTRCAAFWMNCRTCAR